MLTVNCSKLSPITFKKCCIGFSNDLPTISTTVLLFFLEDNLNYIFLVLQPIIETYGVCQRSLLKNGNNSITEISRYRVSIKITD